LVIKSYLPSQTITKISLDTQDVPYVFISTKDIFNLQTKLPPKPKIEKKVQKIEPLKDLKLKGIYHSKSLSFVTLDDNGNSVMVDIGDVFKNYTLKEVFSKSAIFQRDGKEYELKLFDSKDEVKIIKEPFNKNTKKTNQKQKTQTTEQKISNISRDEIKSYKKDMSKIWSNVGIREYKTNGVLDGFIVTYVKKDSVFEDLGLRKGDILKEANGIKLQSYKDALRLYKKIDSTKSFRLVIIRNKKEMELEYEIF